MAIGNIQALAAAAPVNEDKATVDWEGFEEGLHAAGFSPTSALAASWCSFGERNIEALIDSSQLTVIFPDGVYSSVGKRKVLGKAAKYDAIKFSQCRSYAAEEYTDERGLGKYCIEFFGPGGVLLGRLQWSWRAKRFRDSRAQIMAVAEERDRILSVVNEVAGG